MDKKILVCWDGSDQSRNALKYAINEAKEKNLQKIDAVYVKEKESMRIRDMLEDYEVEIDEEILEKKKSAIEALEEQARSIGRDKGIEIEIHVIDRVYGPAVDIVKFAERNGFRHIVVGSHGRSGISRIALGSVAEEIVKKAKCLVTVVRCDWPLES